MLQDFHYAPTPHIRTSAQMSQDFVGRPGIRRGLPVQLLVAQAARCRGNAARCCLEHLNYSALIDLPHRVILGEQQCPNSFAEQPLRAKGQQYARGEALYRDKERVTAERLPGRSNWFERQLATKKTERPTGSGFAGCASRASRHHSAVSVTHRLL